MLKEPNKLLISLGEDKMEENLVLKLFGMTDTGLAREHNEDDYAIDKKQGLYIVADGLGGHKGGEVASKLAVKTILEFFRENIGSVESALKIRQAIEKAHQNIVNLAVQDATLVGMGTTVVLALWQAPDILHIANIGDSRAYLFRDGKISLLSQDHSKVAEMVRQGLLQQEEARVHPWRNIVTRSIGIEIGDGPFQKELNLKENDIILLCSDGLWDMLSDESIREIISHYKKPKEICAKLIAAANQAGGNDNITVIAISVKRKAAKAKK
jgi:protein phosphatase